MKIAGIIAEYNPFHNGHRYHIEETRRRTGCDAVVVVMSGDFVQRGVPAVADRFLRAEAALRCGADVVLELPVYGATASAEDFASAGIRALTALSCVNVVSYGAEDAGRAFDDNSTVSAASEDTDSNIFRATAQFLLDEPGDFHDVLLSHVREGNSYAKARSLALSEFRPEIAEFLTRPNNILAVEYEKAVLATGSPLRTCAVPRSDRGYHDTVIADVCSATAIREAISSEGLVPSVAIPAETSDLYETLTRESAVTADDFSDMLFAELSAHTSNSLSALYDIPEDLANRILEAAKSPFIWTSLADSVKCKAYTRARIDRALCHTLLRLTSENADIFRKEIPYLRVLGFRKNAEGLISEMERSSKVPLLIRFLRDSTKLSEGAAAFLSTDLRAGALYSQVLYRKTGTIREDSRRRLLTV